MTSFSMLFLCFLPYAFSQTGQLVVSVQTATGAGVPFALVRVSARPFKNTLVNYHSSQKTGIDGKTAFVGLAETGYEVCAQLPGSTLLDSCAWLSQPSGVFIHSGESKAFVITLTQGTQLTVNVNDNLSLLAKESFVGQRLRIEVSTKDGHPVPMLVARASNGRVFSALVPADADLRVQVRSADFQLADAAGTHLNMKDYASYVAVHSPKAPSGTQTLPTTASAISFQLVGLQ